MAGYSGTPLAQKLGIKPGQRVVTINAPVNYSKLLAPLPEAVSFARKATAGAGFVHLFISEREARKGIETVAQIARGYRRPLGLVAEKIFRGRDRRDGRHYSRGRPAAWFRGRESLRGRRSLVRIETNGPARKSTVMRYGSDSWFVATSVTE